MYIKDLTKAHGRKNARTHTHTHVETFLPIYLFMVSQENTTILMISSNIETDSSFLTTLFHPFLIFCFKRMCFCKP